MAGEVPASEIVWYQTDDGETRVDVRLSGETVWLSLDQMADLFQRDKSTISRHIANVFAEGELDRRGTVADFATVQAEGDRQVTRQITYYNLDVIISVGYRVKSLRGTQFRRWALTVLREYLVKGFALNDQLLKQAGGGAYWLELLDRIRESYRTRCITLPMARRPPKLSGAVPTRASRSLSAVSPTNRPPLNGTTSRPSRRPGHRWNGPTGPALADRLKPSGLVSR